MNAQTPLPEKILILRRKNKSYSQIAVELDIAKSTVGYWLSENLESKAIKAVLTEKQRLRSKKRIRRVIAAQKKRWAAHREQAAEKARAEFPTLIQKSLFTAGIMLYWGEGDSKFKNPLRLSNTDPRMIALYARFLREIMKIPEEKIRIGLILYPDLSDEECKTFWAQAACLSQSNFMKSQFIKGRHPTNRLSHGICMVVVGSRAEKTKMLTSVLV